MPFSCGNRFINPQCERLQRSSIVKINLCYRLTDSFLEFIHLGWQPLLSRGSHQEWGRDGSYLAKTNDPVAIAGQFKQRVKQLAS
ncbi:hypothetical protein D3C85_790090 [compost metagenome]